MGQKTLVKSSAQHIERGFKAAKLQHFKWQECSLFVLACLLLWCCPRVCCENVDRRLHKKHQVEERDHAVTCNDNFIYKNILIWRRVDLIAGGGVLMTKYVTTKSSLPIGLAELWESEPIGTCKNNNPIHDQGCGYNYLDDRPSKWGFPLTLTKTTWIFNFYCTAVFLKAIQLPWTRWFQKCITLGCQIPRSSF